MIQFRPVSRLQAPVPLVIRRMAAATLAACVIASIPANAGGFLNDMYEEMSGNVNTQAAKIYQTQRAGVITAGGLVWKTPQRNFTPFHFTPLSLKAGCGGVDLFMGSFSMMSKDEFIQMLRAVGQNAAGLLFQLALNAMAPEISGLVSEFSNKLEDWNRHFGNSCDMANRVIGWTGADKVATAMGQAAKGFGVSVGLFNDRGEAEKELRNDGNKVYLNTPATKSDDGTTVFDKETNITWSVLKTGNWSGLSFPERRMLMTLLGTVVVRWSPETDSNKKPLLKIFPPLAIENLKKWVGTAQDSSEDVTMTGYTCGGEPDSFDSTCLNVTEAPITFKGMARQVYASLEELRLAILERRNPHALPNGVNPISIVAMTSIPVGNIINLSTTRQHLYFGEIVLKMYADAIAYDISTRLMEEVVLQVTKAIKQYETHVDQATAEIGEYRTSIDRLSTELRALREEIDGKIQAQNASILDFMKLEEEIYGNISKKVLGNMRFQNARQP